MMRKLTSESFENCAKIGLKPFCLSNPAPADDGYEIQDDVVEVSPPSSGDSVMSALSPMIHVQGAQAKKRKTGDLSSAPKTTEVFGMRTFVPEFDEDQAAARDDPVDDIPDVRTDSPGPLKETTENVNPPSSSKATEDPNTVIVTGTGYSKPATAVLSKHASKEAHPSAEQNITKLKLPHYEKLQFEQLCSGFISRLETSYEMEKSLVNMMRIKHDESVTWAESSLADLKKNLAEQQDARTEPEEKYQLALADMEKMKADHQKFEKKANADQAAIMKRAEPAEENLEVALQELFGLKTYLQPDPSHLWSASHQSSKRLHLEAVYGKHDDDEGSDGKQGAN
ncbi:hypothetical protein ZWY2020_053244 [Hordeum vulgare]|nr:hypothetical protein ZWY2020_053244 [Hordeum vulgare]